MNDVILSYIAIIVSILSVMVSILDTVMVIKATKRLRKIKNENFVHRSQR